MTMTYVYRGYKHKSERSKIEQLPPCNTNPAKNQHSRLYPASKSGATQPVVVLVWRLANRSAWCGVYYYIGMNVHTYGASTTFIPYTLLNSMQIEY